MKIIKHIYDWFKNLKRKKMVNYLNQIENPDIKYEKYFEVMRDFRKGGLNPSNYEIFLKTIDKLPPKSIRRKIHYKIFDNLRLTNINIEDHEVIMREVMRRGIEQSKVCWHPEANPNTCSLDKSGKILVSAAHSIQNNGILSKIVENGHVMGYALDKSDFEGKEIGKNHASIFWGFCNKHDAIFKPIEDETYVNSSEQNFLFAYRAFVVSAHKKMEVSTWVNYEEQSEIDIIENRKIFDEAILNKNYSIIETEVFKLDQFYPVAASSAFYLDFDFNGNPIAHSDERIEDIYVTLFPTENATYFLLSYLIQDKALYENLGNQLRNRNNLESDITMLIGAHTENVFFNPSYYVLNIEKYETQLNELMLQTQTDNAINNPKGNLIITGSNTPNDYLNNKFGINFFCK